MKKELDVTNWEKDKEGNYAGSHAYNIARIWDILNELTKIMNYDGKNHYQMRDFILSKIMFFHSEELLERLKQEDENERTKT